MVVGARIAKAKRRKKQRRKENTLAYLRCAPARRFATAKGR